jgi:hypothetical protein
MKRNCIFIAFVFVILIMGGCKKEENTPTAVTNPYKNKLTLGTGADLENFLITGQTTTFSLSSGAPSIYWRLETENDMAGSDIQLNIDKLINGTPTAFTQYKYNNPQTYGHVFISMFSIKEAGTYKITAILVTGAVTIATQTFTLQ